MSPTESLIKRVPVASILDARGFLGVCELEGVVPFSIKRIYYISDVPVGKDRGGHGHIDLEQVFLCLKGSFQLSVTDGEISDLQLLTSPGDGFYVPKGLWRDVAEFSNDAVCLVLASAPYDASDYIHNFSDFLEWKKS